MATLEKFHKLHNHTISFKIKTLFLKFENILKLPQNISQSKHFRKSMSHDFWKFMVQDFLKIIVQDLLKFIVQDFLKFNVPRFFATLAYLTA